MKKPGEVEKIIFLKIWWLNDQAKKTFALTDTKFNGILFCYFPDASKKNGICCGCFEVLDVSEGQGHISRGVVH